MLSRSPKVIFMLLYASLSFTLTLQQANETHTITGPQVIESARTPASSGSTAVILAVAIVLVFMVLIVLTALIIHVMRKRSWEDQIDEFKAGWDNEEIYLEHKVMQVLRKMHLARKKKPEETSVATASVSATSDKKGETQNDSGGLATAAQQPILPTVNANNSQQVTSPENRIHEQMAPASGTTDVQKPAMDVPHDTLASPGGDPQTTPMPSNLPLPDPPVNLTQTNNTQAVVQPTEPQ